jgi:hypothetical protein
LTRLVKQYLEIVQRFRVAFRQLGCNLVLRGQKILQNFAAVCIRQPIRNIASTRKKLIAGRCREPIILLAGLNESEPS